MNIRGTSRRPISVTFTLGLTLALVGFFVGIRRPARFGQQFTPSSHFDSDRQAPLARTNLELVRRPWSTEEEPWAPDDWGSGRPPVTPADHKAKAAALALRAEHRAFSGAPPTIPHPVGQSSAQECRVCHENGARIGTTVAPAWSHADYTLCTQCHVSEVAALSFREAFSAAATAESSFVGLRGAAAPYRWVPGAPPQIPHSVAMRERCSSCHGPQGKPGLQTSHPQRPSCQQCHTASANLEQRASL